MTLDPRRRRLREEMEHHLAELRAALGAEGLTPAEAEREALRRFGDPDRLAARVDRSRLHRWTDALLRDVAFAWRQARRRPLDTILPLGTLVLGVAATAVVFSVVHAVVLSPLPYEDPGHVVHVSQTSPQGRIYSTSEPNYVDFRARQRSFTEMAALTAVTPVLGGEDRPVSVDGLRVTATFFPVLGLEPVVGRTFTEAEDTWGEEADAVVLSQDAWRTRFAQDPDILGRTVVLDGRPREVVGVVPSELAWPGVEVFVPLAPNPEVYRDDQRLDVLARLAPGVTLELANQDMAGIAADLSDAYPESNDGWGALVRSARDWRIGDRIRRLGSLLLGAVVLFLVLTCATLSNLLLVRATARGGEMGVRMALGAGRRRLTAQLVTEGLILAGVGGCLALLAARFGLRMVQLFGPGDVARLDQATLGGPVLGVALGAALATVLVAGAAPALVLRGVGPFRHLRSGSASGPGGRLRDALVVAQFALAVTVVSGATLLTRSFAELQSVELGFRTEGVVRFTVRLPDGSWDQASRQDHLDRLQRELEALPGVGAVGATTAPPFARMRPSNFVARSDREPARQENFLPVSWRAVTGDYFDAAGIEVLAGRTFETADRPLDRLHPPVVVDETLARTLWPDGEDPVGRLVTWFLPGGQQCEVVGVVASVRDERIDDDPRPRIYRPFTFTAWDQPAVLVRTAGDPAGLVPAIRDAALRVDPGVPAIGPAPLQDDLDETVAWPRFSMLVLGVFGLVALLLAGMGVYGLTAFAVARRQRELGVRVALGASPSRIRWMVVVRGLRLAGLGIALGLGGSLLLAGGLRSVLYGVSPTDPASFAGGIGTLATLAVVAAWLPARRVLRIGPREALMSD